ncbi:hypothetical protein J3B02_005143 [Coemansia erecta]|uniref:50S ribosomal protein L9, chloroplastic n=1 Tax=Coemansia asiatica TaxID=1052880 RepID=A0A9W7XQE5_9FUNG|nr:hypothetical protein LPJ64_001049 [Coemansia asiatica]KAJ2843853.1 hypothetical protein J3B02_005143 [Coemansia erecta]
MNCLTSLFVQTRQPVMILQRGLKKKSKIPVMLLKSIPRVGAAGAVIRVSRGHMRNDLYPKRLAVYASIKEGTVERANTAQKEAALPTKKHAEARRDVHLLAVNNQAIIDQVASLEPLVFERKVVVSSEPSAEGTAQTIYGSLTKADVIKELADKHSIYIERDALSMNDKIKSVGEFKCVVKLIYAGQASFLAKVVPAKDK